MARNPVSDSQVRRPRGIVLVNGIRLDAWIEWEVDNNTFYEADTFRVKFALSELPAAMDKMWWSQAQQIVIELFAGFPIDADSYTVQDLESHLYGRVDNVDYDPVSRTIDISGRDLTAAMIDTKTTSTYQNQTSSQIATAIAATHGLTPVVTKTKTLVGAYFKTDRVRINQQRSEWDLLTALAAEEQFSVYVKGRELHFEPIKSAEDDPYVITWQEATAENPVFQYDGTRLTFGRSLTLARGVVVTVLTVGPKNHPIKVTYPNKAATIKPGQSGSNAQQYTFRYAHMTYEQALKKAQQLHSEISKHEVKMQADMPADNVLMATDLIKVVGTGTAYDQIYYPESIVRKMSYSEGYRMSVSAKNHSPESVVPL